MPTTTMLRAALASTALVATTAAYAMTASPASAYTVEGITKGVPGTVSQATPFVRVGPGAHSAGIVGPALTVGASTDDGSGYTVPAGSVEGLTASTSLQTLSGGSWVTVDSKSEQLSVTAGGAGVALTPQKFEPADSAGRTYRLEVHLEWRGGLGPRYVLAVQDLVPSASGDTFCYQAGNIQCTPATGGVTL
ncbi:MAG: hypothetical protein QM747_09230 [Nocardioides sp.]